VNGVQAQNEKLRRQVDELTARVQALEAALTRSKPGAAPK
jgi:BMFP domain-containing protein YqiC